MNESKKVPSLEQVRDTVAKSRRRRQELELARLELEDLILKLEESNVNRRRQQLERSLHR